MPYFRNKLSTALVASWLVAGGFALPAQAAPAPSTKAALERMLSGPDGNVMVVAHRACWQGSAENSLHAIEACIAAGISMVEIDLRLTRDGVPVVLHDATLDRTTEGSGRVDQQDWADIKHLRLREGLGGDAPLTGHNIPTLEAALRTAKDRILVNLDSKVPVTAEVLALVDALGMRQQVLFKGELAAASVRDVFADLGVVRNQGQQPMLPKDNAEKNDPLGDVASGALAIRFQPILRQPAIADAPEAAIAAYDSLRPVSFEMDVKDSVFARTISPWIAQRCARYWVNSLAGRVYDDRAALVDPEAVWGALISLGVTAIQTDEPYALKAFLDANAHRVVQPDPACLPQK